jgi:hypothetical protein
LNGVAERWVIIGFFLLKKKNKKNSSDNGDMSNKKEIKRYIYHIVYIYNINIHRIFIFYVYLYSPKAYG